MRFLAFTLTFCAALCAGSASAELIAYWDQNSNDLPSGGFGFTPASFPQSADQGAGTLSLANFDETTGGADGAYTTIQSFGGTTDNAQPGVISGGSLSPQGGTADPDTGAFSNNGMQILMNVSTVNYEDIIVSWSQRGTSSGFTSRVFGYSTDGVSFTDLAPIESGVLGSSFATVSYDLSSITEVNDAASVTFRITLDGATGSTGNNRFDNLTVEGSLIPEPTSALLAGLAIGAVAVRRRRS